MPLFASNHSSHKIVMPIVRPLLALMENVSDFLTRNSSELAISINLHIKQYKKKRTMPKDNQDAEEIKIQYIKLKLRSTKSIIEIVIQTGTVTF